MNTTSRHREQFLSKSLSGRQSAGRTPGLSSVLFRPLTLISLILIGIFSFGALVVLSGFAKDLRKAPPGQATPRSVSAVGYQALTEYLGDLNYDVLETRGERGYYDRGNRLVVYTPSRPSSRLKRKLKDMDDEVRLIVLPKWSVGQMIPQKDEEGRRDWARKTSVEGLFFAGSYDILLDDIPIVRRETAPSVNAQVVFSTQETRSLPEKLAPNFEDLQYFDLNVAWTDYRDELSKIKDAEIEARRKKRAEDAGREYKPKTEKKSETEDETDVSDAKAEDEPIVLPKHDVLIKINGRAVLIRLENSQTYILSEPDLINTTAFQNQSGAHLAGAVINEVILQGDLDWQAVDFDVSLHGIEANRNIIKLMVTPPFLAATLCLLAAGGLVAWQGFNRFGDPTRIRSDYAQGPVSLAETAAEFMEIAGRAHGTGEAYAQLMRRQVIGILGFGARSSDHTDTLLDAREKRLNIQPKFAELERAITAATPQSYPQYANALTTWRDAITQTDLNQVDLNKTDIGQEDPSL